MGRVAVVQMNSSAHSVENLQLVEQFMKEAKDKSADLVVLPENFACMVRPNLAKIAHAEVYGQGSIQEKISQLAKKLNLWVVAGTIPLKDKGRKSTASSLVYDGQGKIAARYDKIHLFDARVSKSEAHQESLLITGGTELVVVDTPVGKIGLTVCYDIRFPQLYHKLRMQGAQLFTIVSAFTAVTGRAHWEVLVRARAIENLCYVLAPNQGGLHENGRQTYGHSMIVDPWGKVLCRQKAGIGLIIADINLSHLERLRNQFPCGDHHVL